MPVSRRKKSNKSKSRKASNFSIPPLPVEKVKEIALRPVTWAVCGVLGIATVLTVIGTNSDEQTVATDDLSDDQLDADFLALGALGVSDSASPQSFAVNPDFDINGPSSDRQVEPAPLVIARSDSVVHADAATDSPLQFQQATVASGPLFGDTSTGPGAIRARSIQPTDFREAQPAYSTVPGARVTANRAAWLTGQIESNTSQ